MTVVAVVVVGLVGLLFWRQVAALLLVVLVSLVLGGVAFFAQFLDQGDDSTGWLSSSVHPLQDSRTTEWFIALPRRHDQ